MNENRGMVLVKSICWPIKAQLGRLPGAALALVVPYQFPICLCYHHAVVVLVISSQSSGSKQQAFIYLRCERAPKRNSIRLLILFHFLAEEA